MLDLGSNVNILPRKPWKALTKSKLVFWPIQLCIKNQYCILPIETLEDFEDDIASDKTYADFEVIDIMDDKDPYPTLLGIN